MSFYSWKPYVSAAERKKKADKAAAKALAGGAKLAPVPASRGKIAKTFWGHAWCENLERYSDFANRLPRGRTYVRNGSVIDLQVKQGEVQAQVMGSRLYKVAVAIDAVTKARWQAIARDCSGSIDSLVELLQGRLSKSVMERICHPGSGLFPAPEEIRFECSCPDWASMCKHVAAVLYGIGSRLDTRPELIFALRGVDPAELIARAGAEALPKQPRAARGKHLEDDALADVFGIELMADEPESEPPAPTRKRAAAKRGIPLDTPIVDKASKKPRSVRTRADENAAADTAAKSRVPSAKSGASARVDKGTVPAVGRKGSTKATPTPRRKAAPANKTRRSRS